MKHKDWNLLFCFSDLTTLQKWTSSHNYLIIHGTGSESYEKISHAKNAFFSWMARTCSMWDDIAVVKVSAASWTCWNTLSSSEATPRYLPTSLRAILTSRDSSSWQFRWTARSCCCFMISPYVEKKNILRHFTLAQLGARLGSWAEPLVWTPCSTDKKFQACTQNLSQTLFTLEAQVKHSSGSAQKFLSRAPRQTSVKCPIKIYCKIWLTWISQSISQTNFRYQMGALIIDREAREIIELVASVRLSVFGVKTGTLTKVKHDSKKIYQNTE